METDQIQLAVENATRSLQLVIEQLRAQRNVALDQLSVAQANVLALSGEFDAMQKEIAKERADHAAELAAFAGRLDQYHEEIAVLSHDANPPDEAGPPILN